MFAACAPLLLVACAGPQSTLAPDGPAARIVADLWWAMFIVAALVLLAVVGLWVHALFRPHREHDDAARRRIDRRWIIGGGIILPSVSVAVLLAFGIPMGHRMLPLPLSGEMPLKIEVIGHQWRWEIRYPDQGIVSADHLVIPVGRAIDFHVDSADVIHGFWIPRLGGKIDAIPGRTNVLRLRADQPGLYRGQCAEFCGAGHAHMMLTVEALDAAAFDAWVETHTR
ncbi:MAG: cytochrome c oxidase subunit II [Thiobacillus sp.]|nr:cytochrome c oxidase subunit II [Thiobacillus sp.]